MKWLNKVNKWLETQRILMIQTNCPHTEWDMDNQIRTIKCRECGKTAWVREYKNLYPNGYPRLDKN